MSYEEYEDYSSSELLEMAIYTDGDDQYVRNADALVALALRDIHNGDYILAAGLYSIAARAGQEDAISVVEAAMEATGNPDMSDEEFASVLATASESDVSDNQTSDGCYIATAVYGSYDCPEVWTLRRFRDYRLKQMFWGNVFVRVYYTISPTLVRLFGNNKMFQLFWKKKLDRLVKKLQCKGFSSTPYQDKF